MGYTAHRRSQPRLATAIWASLGAASTLLNVGPVAGASELPERDVVAVRPPSATCGARAWGGWAHRCWTGWRRRGVRARPAGPRGARGARDHLGLCRPPASACRGGHLQSVRGAGPRGLGGPPRGPAQSGRPRCGLPRDLGLDPRALTGVGGAVPLTVELRPPARPPTPAPPGRTCPAPRPPPSGRRPTPR